MQAEDEYIALVVQVQQGTDGGWYVFVSGTHTLTSTPLVPLLLVVRMWRNSTQGLCRGTVRLHNTEHEAPFQSNVQLEELVRAWLLPGT